jgi:hypothetical protein
MRYLPNWFPGTGSKKLGAAWRTKVMDSGNIPCEFVKRQMVAGEKKPSYVTKLLTQHSKNPDEFATKWAAASIYGGVVVTVSAWHRINAACLGS